MSAIEVSLENAELVNKHYSNVKPNRPLMRTLHFVMGKVIRADTHFDNSYNCSAQKAIHEKLKMGKQILMAHNHQISEVDPMDLASMIEREKVFHSMRCNTTIPGKSPLFNHPRYGIVIRNSGAIPVFRPQDIDSSDPEQMDYLDTMRRKANESQIEIVQSLMNQKMHAVIYPEGGSDIKNKKPVKLGDKEMVRDVSKLQKPLKPGIGRIACGVNDPDNLMIVCVGTIYGASNKDIRHPTNFVSYPIPVASTPELVVEEVTETLQWSLDKAYSLVNG